jgi:hypothetical protein
MDYGTYQSSCLSVVGVQIDLSGEEGLVVCERQQH